MTISLPSILNVPEKLYPFILNFDKYTYHLIEGGRASGKTQSVARMLLYIMEARVVRICCGRETQNTIDESVKTVFVDLIRNYNLNFTIKKDMIIHNETGSTVIFKGFREQGRVNIKGLEGIDILWVDESQAITKPTLDIIIPTIRKKNSLAIFTMNRYTRADAVYKFLVGREDCLHIKCNYFDNPFVDEKIIREAEICKNRNEAEYNHIWLGEPLVQASDYLVSSIKIDEAKELKFNEEHHFEAAVMSVDLSASGGDLCVAKLITQKSITQWMEEKTITWSNPDTDVTKGKIINLYGLWKPDILIIDADGLGYPIWISIRKSIPECIGFRGAGKPKTNGNGNERADGYVALKHYIENGWLKLTDENASRQLEYMKLVYKPSGLAFIQDKHDIRKEHAESPDFSDSLMMGIYAINYHANLLNQKYRQTQGLSNNLVVTDFDPLEI